MVSTQCGTICSASTKSSSVQFRREGSIASQNAVPGFSAAKFLNIERYWAKGSESIRIVEIVLNVCG